jgi:hypothetical protein
MSMNIGSQLSLARTQSKKDCAFCGHGFTGIKIARYCDESCRQKAKYQRNKARALRGSTPLSEELGMARPYDWSNPKMPSSAFIVSVLKGGILQDIAKCVRHFGGNEVTRRINDVSDPLSRRIATRKVSNAIIAIEQSVNA